MSIKKLISHLKSIHEDKSEQNQVSPPPVSTRSNWRVVNGIIEISRPAIHRHEVEECMPWRKGPFKINDVHIEAEWDCRMKWNQIEKRLPDLTNKDILDIGCGNGYYMLRSLNLGAQEIVGIDPTVNYHKQYSLLTAGLGLENSHHFLAGWQDCNAFTEIADIIFCFGILYHHVNPIELLRLLKRLLKKGGKLFLETQGVAHEESYAYFPSGKYAGAKGMWFLPSPVCHENWIRRSGFNHVETFHVHSLTKEEQRQTKWSPHPSLKENMTDDFSKTIEGHPPPIRIYTIARP